MQTSQQSAFQRGWLPHSSSILAYSWDLLGKSSQGTCFCSPATSAMQVLRLYSSPKKWNTMPRWQASQRSYDEIIFLTTTHWKMAELFSRHDDRQIYSLEKSTQPKLFKPRAENAWLDMPMTSSSPNITLNHAHCLKRVPDLIEISEANSPV